MEGLELMLAVITSMILALVLQLESMGTSFKDWLAGGVSQEGNVIRVYLYAAIEVAMHELFMRS